MRLSRTQPTPTHTHRPQAQISQAGETLSGHMVWLKEPTCLKDDPQGRGGKPKVDANNPDAARQGVPLVGLTLVSVR